MLGKELRGNRAVGAVYYTVYDMIREYSVIDSEYEHSEEEANALYGFIQKLKTSEFSENVSILEILSKCATLDSVMEDIECQLGIGNSYSIYNNSVDNILGNIDSAEETFWKDFDGLLEKELLCKVRGESLDSFQIALLMWYFGMTGENVRNNMWTVEELEKAERYATRKGIDVLEWEKNC